MAKMNLKDRVSALKGVLIEEARSLSIKNPLIGLPLNHYDEIFDNCYLGDAEIALNKMDLKKLGITHVLNAAKGTKFSQVDTNQEFYKELNISFYGCSLMDVDACKIEKYFKTGSEFIHNAIDNKKTPGRVLVHCYQGISRSATFILAYLMIYRNMKLENALRAVIRKRLICPNNGFLLQLINLENELMTKDKESSNQNVTKL